MKEPSRLWDAKLEMSDIDASINALTHLNPIVENSDIVGGSSSESSFGSENLVGGHTHSNYHNSSKNLDDLELQF